MKIDSYVIRNLKKFGNASVPNYLIDKYGTSNVEKELSKINLVCHIRCAVKEYEVNYYGKTVNETIVYYIAECI